MAVDLRGVSKSYTARFGKTANVLRDVDIYVQVGHVYGILGPSGCGKTTLLQCILGQLNVDTGRVSVFGRPPGTPGSGVPGPRVGYMPQEIALIQELTISETLQYFGRLLQMPVVKIQSRKKYLLGLLHLPEETRLVKNLSGGQQRRLSFCCALIHEPELLILDEPTVGVDPLLRKSIWEHFMYLANETNCTIIITTHYIEETSNADMVAFMRHGRILAEDSPQNFIETHQMQTLEDVFRSLCSAHKNYEVIQKTERRSIPAINSSSDQSNATDYNYKRMDSISSSYLNCSRLTAVFLKNLLRFWRNPGLWILQLLLPVTVVVICTFVFDNFNDLGISYVNDDVGSFGQLYIEHLSTDPIKLTRYSNKLAAKDAVHRGDSWATVFIQKNFSASITERFTNGIFADEMAIDGSEVHIQMDMTNLQVAYILSNEILQAYQRFSEDVLKQIGLDPKIGNLTVKFSGSIYNTEGRDALFRDFFSAGVIICVTFFITCGSGAAVLLMERTSGSWGRSWITGLTEIELVLSNFASESVVLCGQLILVFTYVIFISPLPCKGPVIVLILVVLMQGLCGITFGFILAAVSKDMIYGTAFFLAAMYSNFNIAGFLWPLEGAPIWLRYVGYALPQTFSIEATRSIMLRGWSLEYQTVWLSIVISIVWIIIFNILSVIILRLRR